MVLKVNHSEYAELIKHYYQKKLALFCWGTFGIGKSRVTLDVAKEIAKERKRTFCEWNKLTKEQKQEVYECPEKYFSLIDIRLSEYDSSDLKGLPDFTSNGDKKEAQEFIEWKSPFFAKYLAKKESDGILLFDELNLSVPLVMASCYKIIYDRIINDEPVSNNWLVLGAGNLDSDRAFTHTLPAPLRDRGGECELIVPDVEDWTLNFAVPNRINAKIIGFLNAKKSNIHKVNFEDNQKFVTSRGWERVSKLIEGTEKIDKNSEMVIKSAIGEGTALEFIAFCRISEKLKIDELIKNPKRLEQVKEVDIKYFVVTIVAERYKDKKVNFDKIIEISKVLDELKDVEFTALLWRLCNNYTKESKRFRSDFLKGKTETKFIEKYGNYIN